MTAWLERKEKITQFDAIVEWRLHGRPPPPTHLPTTTHHAHIQMTREPVASLTLDKVASEYGASHFRDALATFLANFENPASSCQIPQPTVPRSNLDFNRVSVFHKIKLWIQDPQGLEEIEDTLDVVHAQRATTTRRGWKLPERFDTVLINTSSDSDESDHCGVEGEFKLQL